MDFIELVEKYCTIIESIKTISVEKLFEECEYILPLIYSFGIRLEYKDEFIDQEVAENNIESPLDSLTRFLGEYNYYNAIYDPIKDMQKVVGSIADDLTDIYLDLKRPLLHYKQNTDEAKANAAWQWQFNIKNHIGEHILSVLKPIYWYKNILGING